MKLQPIEYIGAAPKVTKRRHPAGGWLLIAFAIALGLFLARPFFSVVQAQQSQPNETNLDAAIARLQKNGDFGSRLAAAALDRTRYEVDYDLTYRVIDFPMGDIPADRGKAEDVIIRAFRALDVDLQQLVNADMTANFRAYPQFWGLHKPDPNIDHRRAPNLQRFFSRHGESLEPTHSADDYQFGDIVVWHLPERASHIGIVVPGPGQLSDEKWVVQNVGSGPKWEDELFSYQIIGHYRYVPPVELAEVTE